MVSGVADAVGAATAGADGAAAAGEDAGADGAVAAGAEAAADGAAFASDPMPVLSSPRENDWSAVIFANNWSARYVVGWTLPS